MDSKDFWKSSFTPVHFPRAEFSLSPHNTTSFWGSCFAQESGNFFYNLDLPTFTSPFGIIYNPLTMAYSLSMVIHNELRGNPFFHLNLWRHEGFHSSCCFRGDENRYDSAVNHFNKLINRGHGEILKTDTLVLTLGTAFVYQNVSTGNIVNNCHKLPQNMFSRKPFNQIDRGESQLLGILRKLKKLNPSLNVILTVSPVRHLRDDARENSYSKALLRCLCHDLNANEDFIHYFPSYEIVMDELRDYRWYSKDLCHPTPMAVEYIMERFIQWCGTKELEQYIEEKKKERKHNSHRPLI
jgi:hypothetical protein